MKKNYVLGLCFYVVVHPFFAQTTCQDIVEKAGKEIRKESPFKSYNAIFTALQPCAASGNATAQNYVGLFYLEGLGTTENKETGFQYIQQAAFKNNNSAQYNLGRLYKYGIGCTMSFTKAVAWFEKATENGNQKAGYSLGYMYYKGLGVPQDYEKAVSWFTRSTDPMAGHFLGLCYYLGYGVEANEEKALEILLENKTLNSRTLVSYIKKAQKQKNKATVAGALEDTAATIPKEAIVTANEELEHQETPPLRLADLNGEFVGKIIQYDWSKKHIQRVIPVTLSITTNSATTATNVKLGINDQVLNTKVSWQDQTLYFDDISQNITLNKLYSAHPKKLTLDYNLFSMGLRSVSFEEHTFFTGNIATYIPDWTEYGEPMRIILKPKGSTANVDDEIIEALAAQEEAFIKLYPVPFKTQLTVQYQLNTASNVAVSLFNINGLHTVVVSPNKWQEAGDYLHTIPVATNLPSGLYIVKVIAGSKVYTRTIIKEN